MVHVKASTCLVYVFRGTTYEPPAYIYILYVYVDENCVYI